MIDESGTVIPKPILVGGSVRQMDHGFSDMEKQSIMRFKDEGTFTVYLTVNSAVKIAAVLVML